MKNTIQTTLILTLFLFFSTMKAQNYYDQQWKKIESNSKQGVFKNNLSLVKEIQDRAIAESNVVQIVKSVKAEYTILNLTEDNTKNNEASLFFAKIQSIEPKLKGDDLLLYKVLMMNFFSNYYQNNSWSINQRTQLATSEYNTKDIETWTKNDFKNYLLLNFKNLDKEKIQLQKISLSQYKSIFENESNFEFYPSLYDWYAEQKIIFLRDSLCFTPNEIRINQNEVQTIFKELVANNQGNAKLYFEHLQLNCNCEIPPCKESLVGLQKLYNSPVEGDYKVKIGEDIVNDLLQNAKEKEALHLIAALKKTYPKSKFISSVIDQENRILQPSLNIRFETISQSQKPIPLVAEAKNVRDFSLNIYQAKEVNDIMNFHFEKYNTQFETLKKSLIRKENYTLPTLSDYQNHKTTVVISPLPSGIYWVEYLVEGKVQGTFELNVSDNIILTNQKSKKNNQPTKYQWVNNESGKIIANTSLDIYERVQGKSQLATTIKTDNNGLFSLSKSNNTNYSNYYLLKDNANNSSFLQNYSEYYDENEVVERKTADIFLDRAIYRPGQLVYFKVINRQLNNKKTSVIANLSQQIKLIDSNGQEIAVQKFTTNDFGSYHGSFTLPTGQLNGIFHLSINENEIYSDKSFRVEEYKRPQFQISFEPIVGDYKYGQNIVLKGKVTSFSGVPLSDTTVNFEIKKEDIRSRYFYWLPIEKENENSILKTIKTNDKGEFSLEFNLEKDKNTKDPQVDNFEFNASVTDSNGETQTAKTSVKVATVGFYFVTDTLNNGFSDEEKTLKVETKNFNDQPLTKNCKAQLSKLVENSFVVRDNFTSQIQDLPQLSKSDFHTKFPHDFFDKSEKENDKKIEKILWEKENSSTSPLSLGKLSPGFYKLKLYNNDEKDSITTEQTFRIWDKNGLDKKQNPFLVVVANQLEIKRGENTTVYIFSAIPNAKVNIYTQTGDGKTVWEQKSLKDGVLQYKIITPNNPEINKVNLQIQLVAYNDVQMQTLEIKIKDEQKPLQIEMVTFRDKIEPGTKEKWSVKILNNDNKTAEILASMYDKSLDQFAPNVWRWYPLSFKKNYFADYNQNNSLAIANYSKRIPYKNSYSIVTPQFRWTDDYFAPRRMYKTAVMMESAAPPSKLEGKVSGVLVTVNSDNYEINIKGKDASKEDSNTQKENGDFQIRENLNETAFFYPNLLTDKDGMVYFEFTSPEALTQWKLSFLAHTQEAKLATLSKTLVTQKDFSVTPNYPRFLREGDELVFKSKVNNLTKNKLDGVATLQILDAQTLQDISGKFNLNEINQSFVADPEKSKMVEWKIKVPPSTMPIIIRNKAVAGSFSDGEQKGIALLSNRMLVTDALPIFVKEGQQKSFVLDNLKNNSSASITNFSTSLELTTNPIWEVIFALPSLKNDNNNSADVVFNKWFADVVATEIIKANPRIKKIFDEYQRKGLLQSNLEKNQELKQVLLQETPWVLEAKNEKEQMEKLARLFDANSMKNSITQDAKDLLKLQNPDGGFSWVKGSPSTYYSSLYILKNLGKLKSWLKENYQNYPIDISGQMEAKLIQYVDGEVNKYWDTHKENIWNNAVLDYLDTRHYWETQYPLKNTGALLKKRVIEKAPKADIKEFSFFGLHRAALLFNDYQLTNLSQKIIRYLKETSTQSQTQGIYWKQNLNDWGWYNTNIENQAGAIEAMEKLGKDENFVEELKIWLITQKEVSHWDTSRGTAAVIYSILNAGKSWTTPASEKVDIVWGNQQLQPQTEATGYIKQKNTNPVLDKNLATVTVKKEGPGIVQGGLFWQYFEDLNKIKSSVSYISITKELYKKVKTENGEELQKISEKIPLKIGDRVTVRMILNSDRAMEFVHLKDMRAAGFEPVDVLSGYQWKNNLGYYQETKDAATNFYIEYMPKGKFVFEYDYVCNAAGIFSNGITTLQNYYAPQMNAHSEGITVRID